MKYSLTSAFLALLLASAAFGCADSGSADKVPAPDGQVLDTSGSELSVPDAAQDLTPSDLSDGEGHSDLDVLADDPDSGADTATPPSDASDLTADKGETGSDTLLDSDDTNGNDVEDLSAGEHVIEVAITSGDDVVSSYLMDPPSGSWNLFSGETAYWGRRSADPFVSYHNGLRFVGLHIPAGAEILSATLSIRPHNAVDKSHQLVLNVYAERQSDSAPFDPTNTDAGRPDQRLKTSAFVDKWVTRCAEPCNSNIEYDCPQREADCWEPALAYDVPKDLSALLQEVIDLPGWQSGNPLTLFVVNSAGDTSYDLGKYNDSRIVTGFVATAPETAPKLTVRFRVL